MGQIAKGGKLDLRRPGSKPSPALWPRWGALNQFMSPQATQPIENIDSARENPRKSKSNNRSTGVRFAARPRLADVIQVASRRLKGFAVSTAASLTPHFASQKYAGLDKGANFSPLPPCKPLKTNDRRRFAAENGGKRRPLRRRNLGFPRAPEAAWPPVERPRASRRQFNQCQWCYRWAQPRRT
jgi:hypothetical protein